MTVDEREKLIANVHDPSFKGVFVRSLSGILYLNEQKYFANEKTFLICKEKLMTVPVVVFAKKNFYLLDAINRKIKVFHAAGLISYWHSRAIRVEFSNNREVQPPTTLDVNHVSGCFVLLLFGLTFSFIAFITEVTMKSFSGSKNVLGSFKLNVVY